jgi:hypothetical protein
VTTTLAIIVVVVGCLGLAAGIVGLILARSADANAEAARRSAEEIGRRAELAVAEADAARTQAQAALRKAEAADRRAEGAEHSAEIAGHHAEAAEQTANQSLEKSQTATEDATAALRQADEAADRAADALEKANNIGAVIVEAPDHPDDPEPFTASVPIAVAGVPGVPAANVRWSCEQVRGASWVMRNTGTAIAHNALLIEVTHPPKYIRAEEIVPRDVPPGDHLQFRVFPVRDAPPPRVRVVWREDGDEEQRNLDTTLVV